MDLVNLASHHSCLKMMVQGTTSRPFSAVTRPVAPQYPSPRAQIIAESRRS